MRLLATVLTAAVVAMILAAGPTGAASAKQESCNTVKKGITFYRGKTWKWQDKLGVKPTRASLVGAGFWANKSCPYLGWIRGLWQKRSERFKSQYRAQQRVLYSSPTSLTTSELYSAAQWQINHGGIYSHAHGAVSPRLSEICYELINRAFSPYGTQEWAKYVVRRESGCNPAAINYTYSDPGERATGLSQMIPNVHRWVDYNRVMHDMRYSIAVFKRLSNNGKSTGPWCLC